MITDLVISTICSGGNHADVTFVYNGNYEILKGIEYTQFFVAEYPINSMQYDVQYLLNQFEHTNWTSLKTAMENA